MKPFIEIIILAFFLVSSQPASAQGIHGSFDTSSVRLTLSVGGWHTLLLTGDHKLLMWGANGGGQCADPLHGNFLTPIASSYVERADLIAAGASFSIAQSNDTLLGWGTAVGGVTCPRYNDAGWEPNPMPRFASAVAISAGAQFAVALMPDSTLRTWGNNSCGQLGCGLKRIATRCDSAASPAVTSAIAISAGERHCLALLANHTLMAWGDNSSAQLGMTPISWEDHRFTPQPIKGINNVVAIAAGNVHSLALKNDGTVWSWGSNLNGMCGVGKSGGFVNRPAQVLGLTDVVAVQAGREFSLALKKDGTVWAWGTGNLLGIGSMKNQLIPQRITTLTDIVQISTGPSAYHSFAVQRDGTVWGWGLNNNGNIGNGTQVNGLVPEKIAFTP